MKNLLELYRSLRLLFAGSLLVFAQYTTSTINRSVSDASESTVADATVTARNMDTGAQNTTATSTNGAFRFPGLTIGNYEVTVEKSGFNKFVQTGVKLAVGQVANVVATLKVGDVTQAVTVSADTQVIETQTGTVSQEIDQQKIVDLPLNGRQPQALLFLSAGSVNFRMDGNNHNNIYLNTNLPFPNPDAIQQFSVQTNDLSAKYGVGAGAVVNIIIKSGTNQWHGDAFEFIRNGAVNARNFFAPTPDTLKRNKYGGDIGLLILKNKSFLFGTYQGTPIRQAAQGAVAFVPTAQERTSNFSWLGWTSQTGGFRSGAPYILSSLGVQVASPPSPQIYISVPGYFTVDTADYGNFDRGSYTGRKDVTIQRGINELHVGGELIRISNNIQNGYSQSGEFNFAGALSGNNLADFILGNQSDFPQGGGEYKNLEGLLWSLYVQDNIRASSKLRQIQGAYKSGIAGGVL